MMLLNITPSGNDLQRKMLLNHSSNIRNIFFVLLLLIPIAIFVGDYYNKKSVGDSMNQDLLKNVAKIIVNGDESISQGTAFLVCNSDGTASGYLFTARHVIDGTNSEHVTLTFPKILKEDETPLTTTASIVWASNVPFDGADLQTLRYDVGLLKLDDISVLPNDVVGFFIGSEMNIKDPIAIYGFPKSHEYANSGEISSTEYSGEKDLMLLSCELEHGLSGSPVYREESGEVLGIAIASEEQTNIINIALKMKRVIELLDRDGKKDLIK